MKKRQKKKAHSMNGDEFQKCKIKEKLKESKKTNKKTFKLVIRWTMSSKVRLPAGQIF